MSLACPRCQVSLIPRTAAPHPGAPMVTAHLCPGCGGLWIGGDALAAVSAALGSLPARRKQLAQARGAVICSGCGAGAVPVDLLGVAIDVCPECAGVWLDAGEYETLARMEAAGTAQSVACVGCGAVQPRPDTYMSEAGLICAACFQRAEVDAADDRAQRSLEEADRERTAAWFLGALLAAHWGASTRSR